jgi:hypothetical protein
MPNEDALKDDWLGVAVATADTLSGLTREE